MALPDLSELDREPVTDTELRRIDPADLYQFLTDNWGQIHVEAAPSGQKIQREVHDELKTGDYEVSVGKLLIENHAGTELPAGDFVRWMVEDEGFTLSDTKQELPTRDAIDLLESSEIAEEETRTPVFRLLRPLGVGEGPAMCFEFFGGSQSEPMRIISRIGNKLNVTPEDKELYREQVFRLTSGFGAKGTTKAKELMGVPPSLAKEKLLDDCFASLMTSVGWEKVVNHLGIVQSGALLEMGAAVGTMQALVTAMVLAEQEHRPLVVRVGAPAFGLGNEKTGLNYIMNTQPDMVKTHGLFACADFGAIMSEGGEKDIQPHVTLYGKGNPHYHTVFFLNGGGPLLKMLRQHYVDRDKPINGMFSVVRASRVGGTNDWGALFTLPESLPRIMNLNDIGSDALFS